MSIFLLSALPLAFFFYISIEFTGLIAADTFKKAYISGLVVFVVSIVILTTMNSYIQSGYTRLGLFFYHWFFDIFFFLAAGTAGYFILYFRGFLVFDERKEFPFLYTFFSGYLTPVGLYTLIRNFYTLDSYLLFFYPVLIAVSGFWITFIMLEVLRHRGYKRVIILISILPFTFIAAIVPVLYYLNFHSYALMLDLFLLLISSSVYSILRHDYRAVFGS